MGSHRYGDSLLWVSLGILGVFTAYTIRDVLGAVRTAAQINHEEHPPELISQHTEDALKLDTLRDLAFGSNRDIRLAANRIIIERSMQPEVYQLLLKNIAGKDHERREQALKSLRFLSTTSVRDAVATTPSFEVLITVLCDLTPKNPPISPNDETNHTNRTQTERDILHILYNTMCINPADALRAGLIHRWLSKFPFGGTDTPEAQKIEIVQRLKTGQSEDVLLSRIIGLVCKEPEGRRQLRKYGLIGSAMDESRDEDGDVVMASPQEMLEQMDMEEWNVAGVPRVHEESVEEQALRRRRREAMVISDDGEPLGRENIIQRMTEREEVLRQMSDLMNGYVM